MSCKKSQARKSLKWRWCDTYNISTKKIFQYYLSRLEKAWREARQKLSLSLFTAKYWRSHLTSKYKVKKTSALKKIQSLYLIEPLQNTPKPTKRVPVIPTFERLLNNSLRSTIMMYIFSTDFIFPVSFSHSYMCGLN